MFLDRLTDKVSLEDAYEARLQRQVVIDAHALADTLRAKVVGQSQVIGEIADQLRPPFGGAPA